MSLTNSGFAAQLAAKHGDKNPVVQKSLTSHLENALNFADADKSDPFARNRAIAHTLNGVAGYYTDEKGKHQDGSYRCKVGSETRELTDGKAFSTGKTEYTVTTYTNLARP